MKYNAALTKAWLELKSVAGDKKFSLLFLADEYEINLEKEKVLSLSADSEAPGHISVLILHFLLRKLKGLPLIKNKWISFKDLAGGLIYYPVFKKRAIDFVVRKYGENPKALFELIGRFDAVKAEFADTSIIIEVFTGVPVLISLWRGDEEFGAEANILFDKSIENIFCTEDVVVLAGVAASMF